MRVALPLIATISVLIGGIPRILRAADAVPDVLRGFTWTDPVYTYLRDGGRIPYWQSLYEYPPVTGYLAGIFSLLAPNPTIYAVLWTVVLAACAGAVATLLLSVAPTHRVMRWSLAPQLLLLGTLNFDLLAALFVVLSVVRARSHVGPVALAFGIGAKLFPLICVPLLAARSRTPLRTLLLLGAASLAIWVPAMIADHPPQEGTAFYAGLGTNFDSVWGLLARALNSSGLPGETIVLPVTLIGLALTLAAFLPRLRSASVADAFAIAIFCVLLWTRRYSPQYSLWILPFYALLAIPGRAYALLVAADVTVFLAVSQITLVRRDLADPAVGWLVSALVIGLAMRHFSLILGLRALIASRVRA